MVTLCHPVSGKIVTKFLSSCIQAWDGIELWRGRMTGRLFLYDRRAMGEKVLWRLETGNMISPIKPLERLTFLGDVWHRDSGFGQDEYVELSRVRLKAKRVLVWPGMS